MLSVSDAVGALVARSAALSEGLSRGLLNTSAVARELQADVERRVGRPVSTGAIVMALRRLPAAPEPDAAWGELGGSDLVLRSNLFEVTYAISPSLHLAQGELLRLAAHSRGFITMTCGLRETTVIASNDLAGAVREVFAAEQAIEQIGALSSITMRLPARVVATPGAYAHLLRSLAWQGINVIEVVSTFRELTILLHEREAEHAWRLLRQAENLAAGRAAQHT